MKLPVTVATRSARGTARVAARLAETLEGGEVVGLFGDLGAGKTVFARGLARALGVPESVPVSSPTFTMMNVLPGRVPMYHLDLYRVGDAEELLAIGFLDLLGGPGVVVVEWPERGQGVLPDDLISVVFRDLGANARELTVQRGWPTDLETRAGAGPTGAQ